jgi:rhodanese-related sulfurtransferase
MPLDQIRNLSHRLEPGPSYLVYCRNGQRSRVAAFLLKERGLEAVSVTGGIADWPYDIDLGPIEDVDKLMV